MDAVSPPCWSIVLPVKPLRLAKTRLALPPALRADVVLAMALDTAAAALRCARVGQVVAVTDDERAAGALTALGVRVVPDAPDAGLNPALRHGLDVAVSSRPECGAATMSADLPALRPHELARALDAAADRPLAMVADLSGAGTTLLTALPGTDLLPAYGPGSRTRHEAAGHVVIDVDGIWSVRRDVDTLDDLAGLRDALAGRHTGALLERLDRALGRPGS